MEVCLRLEMNATCQRDESIVLFVADFKEGGMFWEVLEEGSASGRLQYINHSTVITRGNATCRWSAKANELLDPPTVNILTPFHGSNYCVVNQRVYSVYPDLDCLLFKHLCLKEHILVLFSVGKRLLSGIKQ